MKILEFGGWAESMLELREARRGCLWLPATPSDKHFYRGTHTVKVCTDCQWHKIYIYIQQVRIETKCTQKGRMRIKDTRRGVSFRHKEESFSDTLMEKLLRYQIKELILAPLDDHLTPSKKKFHWTTHLQDVVSLSHYILFFIWCIILQIYSVNHI